MKLAPGARLGPYEIVAPLGAGGMGEVYSARDTRLGRTVAVKILSAEFAHDSKLKIRFEHEARAISAISHPHICALYDVGPDYLVMEYCEGKTLARRIDQGPLPAEQVIEYGIQIAGALEKAHRAGIIHRDLKPSNVMITKSGLKLLDFGLAKQHAGSSPEESTAAQLTEEGKILGTIQYMAPELLQGKEADARSDIFALGLVLYEMATRRPAFSGTNRASLIASILEHEPPHLDSPAPLDRLIRACLAKDPDERIQSASDVRLQLRWLADDGRHASPGGFARRRLVNAAFVSAVLIAATAVVAATHLARRLATVPRRVTQTNLAAPIGIAAYAPLAMSPDGRKLAVLTTTASLWIHDFSTGEGKLLKGTEEASFPFWAPDGHAVGFIARGKLKTVNVETGLTQTIADAPQGRGGAWSQLGVIVFANISGALMKVGENGGTPVVVTNARGDREVTRNPTFLPDGKHYLYSTANLSRSVLALRAGSIDGNLDRKVLDYASQSSFVDGWLLTVHGRNLVAQRFDDKALALTGRPIAIAQDIDWYEPRWTASFAAAADVLVYQHAPQPKRQLLRLDSRDGRAAIFGETAYMVGPAVSHDGGRVIIERYDASSKSSDLWMVALDGTPATRLTFDGRSVLDEEAAAVFSPDGQRVIVASETAFGHMQLFIQPAGGGTQEALMSATSVRVCDWSRDGKSVLIDVHRGRTSWDLEVLHLDGDRKPVPLLQTDDDEMQGRFSPDGKWIAYSSLESGRYEVYVTKYPTAAGKWQVSTNGGSMPFWSADGKKIYYLAGDRVVGAAVHKGDSFSVDAPQPVDALGDHIVAFAVAHNGRIVALREIDPGKPPLNVVTNWQELLKR